MKDTLQQIENLVGIMQLWASDSLPGSLAAFNRYSEQDLAEMLCKLAVTHLDEVHQSGRLRRKPR